MKRFKFVLVFVLTAFFADAQKDKVILAIDGDPVFKSEFEYVFEKTMMMIISPNKTSMNTWNYSSIIN